MKRGGRDNRSKLHWYEAVARNTSGTKQTSCDIFVPRIWQRTVDSHLILDDAFLMLRCWFRPCVRISVTLAFVLILSEAVRGAPVSWL
jgi:hypothetical protein